MNKRHRVFGFAAALLWMAGASAAETGASEVSEPDGQGQVTTSVLVRYSPGALSSDAGVRSLHAELERAAREACGRYDMKRAAERQRWTECYETALAQAVEQIGDHRVAGLAN